MVTKYVALFACVLLAFAVDSLTADGNRAHCTLPAVTGPCRSNQPRFYYAGNGRCEGFIYGGCEGNANNFHSESECLASCGPRP